MWKHLWRSRLSRNILAMRTWHTLILPFLRLICTPADISSSSRFIGEETYSAGGSRDYLVTDAPTWIVDPLDGTVNYTHLFPMFCVSIAFCLNGIPVIGVIYQPVLDTTYSSLVGHGAWQDDRHATKKRKSLPFVQNPKAVLPVSSSIVLSLISKSSFEGLLKTSRNDIYTLEQTYRQME